MALGSAPAVDLDLFSDEVLTDPYPTYAAARHAGAAVYLNRYDLWALPRYTAVREALHHYEIFTSTQGVAMNDEVNHIRRKGILSDDGDLHRRMRAVLSDRLGPRSLRRLTIEIETEAEALVARAVERGRFDAVKDLAEVLPVSVVGRLIGLPEDERMPILEWAQSSFSMQGPMSERTRGAIEHARGLVEYLTTNATRARLAPDSWGVAIYDAADRGEIPPEAAFQLIFSLAGAGMDTTISALGSAVWLFGKHPDQWQKVRADRSLIPSAFNEILRMETPIQYFSRVLLQDQDVDGVTLPQGARVLIMYGSGNRDERKWPDADQFDVQRNPTDHLAFGHGLHVCVGRPLAQMEAHALLGALARRVTSFELGALERPVNNTIRRITSLPVAVELA